MYHHPSTPILLPPTHPPPKTMPKLPKHTTRKPSPLVLHMCSPCTNHFPNPHIPALSQSSPQHVQLALSTSSRTRMHTSTRSMLLTGRRRSRLHCTLVQAQSAGNSHGHGSIPSRTTTSMSGASTNVRGRYQWRPVGGVAKNSGCGPRPPGPTNGPERPGAHRLTYAHGSSVRLHRSLLPLTLWMSPMNQPLAPDLGSYYPSGPCAGAETTAITTTAAAADSAVWKLLTTSAAASPVPGSLPLEQYHQYESRQHESQLWRYALQTGVS